LCGLPPTQIGIELANHDLSHTSRVAGLKPKALTPFVEKLGCDGVTELLGLGRERTMTLNAFGHTKLPRRLDQLRGGAEASSFFEAMDQQPAP
jgi:hypothetical protein